MHGREGLSDVRARKLTAERRTGHEGPGQPGSRARLTRECGLVDAAHFGAEPASAVGYNESIAACATRRPTSGPLDAHLGRPPGCGAEAEGWG
jgi:hypothetical protein